MLHEYESAANSLLEAGIINRQQLNEEMENIKSAARRTVFTDSDGLKHYPPTREHVLEIMENNKILRRNIDAIKKVHFDLAAVQ